MLETIRQKVDTLSELRESKKSIMFTKKVLVDLEYLIEEIDDHIEFKKEYIPYLRFIDLSYIDSKNLKVSGIDWSKTNIKIDPQTVYRKDLSNSKFNDDNIVFRSLEGCNLSGTDISEESESYGIEQAFIDEKTKLPKDKLVARSI